MTGLVEGKVCLVTGAASGIGLATARALAREGGRVWGADLSEGPPSQDPIIWRTLDVTKEADWRSVVEEIVDVEKRVDVLVNNAGIVYAYESITDVAIEDWRKVIEVNQFGVFLGMRAVLTEMLKHNAGSIINISSIWGLVGAKGVAAYQASKGAVTVMTKNAATSYAPLGVRVNSVHPGFIATPLTAPQEESLNAELISKTPMLRQGEAAEVAEAVVWLASDRSSFVTGVSLPVDGGFTAV